MPTASATRTESLRSAGDSAEAALNGGYHLAYVIGAALVVAALGIATLALRNERQPAAAAQPAYSEAG